MASSSPNCFRACIEDDGRCFNACYVEEEKASSKKSASSEAEVSSLKSPCSVNAENVAVNAENLVDSIVNADNAEFVINALLDDGSVYLRPMDDGSVYLRPMDEVSLVESSDYSVCSNEYVEPDSRRTSDYVRNYATKVLDRVDDYEKRNCVEHVINILKEYK